MSRGDGKVTVTSVNHGELWVVRPYLGMQVGIAGAVVTAVVLAIAGGSLLGALLGAVVGLIAGAIAGMAIVFVGMAFPIEQAGYGREMGIPGASGPTIAYRMVAWLYVPVSILVGAGVTIGVARLIG